ncbi:MAG: SpoIIE family protein phosphatase [Anaerolineae bacterium]|nr:SpoIIE family protein phosphatase [Anaerolineae bacterium]
MTTATSVPPSGERLELLYRLSQTFNSSLDLGTVLNRVMDEVIAVIHAERGFVMLHDVDGKPIFRVARGMDHKTIDEPRFQVSRSVVEQVAHDGLPVLTSNAQIDGRFKLQRSVRVLGLRAILCVPLKIKDKILGVVYVDNRLQAGIFSQADLDLLVSIASSAAIAIENARLYQVAVERGRLERELQMARELQTSFLPHETPSIPGWEFAARWQPAREVAGDYYDFIDGEQFGVVIADVCDKGMPAALFMVLTRSIVRASLGHTSCSADDIAHANRLICADSESGMFVTLFYARIEPEIGRVTYVNGGHNPPLLFNQKCCEKAEQLIKLTRTGMALGVMADTPYAQQQVHLDRGDLILLYTDGVTEATNECGQEFGMERLQQVLFEHRHLSAVALISELESDIHEFVGDAPSFDDIAIVVAKRSRLS